MASERLMFVGTYTEPLPHVPTAHAEGIYRFWFDPATGRCTAAGVTTGIENPTYVTVDPGGQYLYAVSELEGGRENLCSAYSINRDNGSLTLINRQPTLGQAACYVKVDASGKVVLVANYSGGQTVVLLPVRDDGGLDPVSSKHQHSGSSVNTERQDGPHGHCAVPDTANQYVFVADLGIDQLVRYRLDAEAGQLVPSPAGTVRLKAGVGPRHLVFHPGGRFAYVVCELEAYVTAFTYDAASGILHEIQTLSTLPEGFAGQKWAAAIRVTPDGRFLYASNRGHDSLALYAIDPDTGHLTALGHQSTHGSIPRDFTIDPTGQWLLAANQATDSIVTFKINPTTGLLEETGISTEVATPVSLAFVP